MICMEKIGEIEIKVVGKLGNLDLTPNNYDIKHIAALLQNVEDLLFPTQKRERPLISYDIKEGSVRHIFKTHAQHVIGFSAVLNKISETQSLAFLESKTASALENLQKHAVERNHEIQIFTSVTNKTELVINASTKFFLPESTWADAEFYFYGTLKDAGGKSKANIHLDTLDYGYLTIETGQEFLMVQEENLLYKNYGVRAMGRQNAETGELDPKSLKLKELVDYSPKFDPDYLKTLIQKAKKKWKGVDKQEWLQNLRGGYEG